MSVWMQPIKVGGPKLKAEPNHVPGGDRLRCNGCPSLSCIRQELRTQPWRYYCDAMRRNVDPWKVSKAECPLGRSARRGRPPKEDH